MLMLVFFSFCFELPHIIFGKHICLAQNTDWLDFFAIKLKITDEANLRKNKVGLNDSNESAFLPEGSEVKEKFNSSGGESSAAHDSDVKICIGNGFEVKDKFNSSGGELNAAHDSDVKICIGNGAIPTGVSQEVFYRVVYDTTELLRNIPVGPDETLISPVIECGPHDIRLLKPLKIIIPHCLYMGKAKKEWITVYRTDPGNRKIPGLSIFSWIQRKYI